MDQYGSGCPGYSRTNLKVKIYFICGKSQHQPGQKCQAMGKTCKECGEKDHFAVVCKFKKQMQGSVDIQNPNALHLWTSTHFTRQLLVY